MTISCNLQGEVAFVSGATSGFGRQFARTLAASGAAVAIGGRRRHRLEGLEQEIAAEGGRALAIVLDVTEAPSIRTAVEAAESELGPIDILVNNAGISIEGRVQDISEADYDAVLDTNLKGPFMLAQEVARRMMDRDRGGRIINIASMAAHRSFKGLSTYCMSKAALVAMTRSMALEWARHDINVNAICPGYIETEMNRDFFASDTGKAVIASFPRKRLGDVHDLDGLLLLLASGASDFITGAAIEVDDAQSL